MTAQFQVWRGVRTAQVKFANVLVVNLILHFLKGVVLGHDDGKVSLWSPSGELVFTWWPHEAPVTRLCLRGHGKAPLILSAGDCAAVSQFIPGGKQQEVRSLIKQALTRFNVKLATEERHP